MLASPACPAALPKPFSQRLQNCSRLAPAAAAMAQRRSVVAAAAAAAGGNEDVRGAGGAMLQPSVVNTPWARALGVSAAVAATAASTTVLPSQGAAFVHLLAFAVLLGVNVWTTFAAGIVMFKNLPRQTFGRLQAKLFPIYFALTTASSLVLLGSLLLGGGSPPSSAVTALGVAALGSLANLVAIEPKATALMFERYDIENKPSKGPDDEAAIKRLYKQFGMWHGISSLANLAVLAATAAYGWALAGRLVLLGA